MLTIFNLTGGCSLANIPPSERPKAKPSRKIDGKGPKSQLQAALQQHSSERLRKANREHKDMSSLDRF